MAAGGDSAAVEGENTRPAESRPPSESASSMLTRAFEVLDAFDAGSRVLTLSQISRRTGLPKPTVHRIVHRLEGLRVLEAHGSRWKLGVRLRGLAAATPVELLRTCALPHLAQLHADTRETVRLGVLRGPEVVVLEVLQGAAPPASVEEVGRGLPTHASALGRAMLAFAPHAEVEEILDGPLDAPTSSTLTDPVALLAELRTVRQTGLSFSRDELVVGVGAVASPILVRNRAIGAVSVRFRSRSGPSASAVEAVRLAAARIARDTAARLSEGRQGWWPFES